MKKEEWHRTNFEMHDDGIYYCDGLHEKNQSCDMIKLTIGDVEEIVKLAQLKQEEPSEEEKCDACDGSGMFVGEHYDELQGCNNCSGKGFLTHKKK